MIEKMRRLGCLLLLLNAGCSGETPPTSPDAPRPTMVDADLQSIAEGTAADKSALGAAHAPPDDNHPPDGRDGRPLELARFRPRSMLQTSVNQPPRAKFSVVDVHMHPRHKLHHSAEGLDDYVRLMDDQNIALSVSLDGQTGVSLDEHLNYLWTKYRDRFVVFANVDWQGAGRALDPATWDCQRPEFGRLTAAKLREAKQRGVSGLKFFKRFGLSYRNPDGSLLAIDDPRWDPIWTACGELGLVVIIHTADPAAFFTPVDEHNERWEELSRHPDWSFYGDEFPSRDELLAARNRVIARHPRTIFIGAHVANNPEDLATVGRWLDEYPNLYVEIAARLAELGRQPYTSRAFFIKYADRILFGTDGPRSRDRLLPHWRYLETYDEYFPYAGDGYPPQGLWNIHGVGLPDDVLKKVYHENAARIIPGVRERLKSLAE